MRKAIGCAALFVLLTAGAASADNPKKRAQAEVEFGIQVAEKGLWREALYRWEKAVELDPQYAAAYNNLAIAYEHEGMFDKARQAYEKAAQLEPGNTYVRQNYEFFKEINDRASRRNTR
jgi:Tfp pilus assembly protein PilF